jgi:hypothetical protein
LRSTRPPGAPMARHGSRGSSMTVAFITAPSGWPG